MRLLVLLLLAFPAFAAEPLRAFIEVETPGTSFFVHQRIPVTLRIGVDREYFDAHAVPLFSRRMDLEVQVKAPFVDELGGVAPLPSRPGEGERLRFSLNGRQAEGLRVADRTIRGRAFTVVEIRRRFLMVEPGEVAIVPPILEYADAERFTDDLLSGRHPVDPRPVTVGGIPLTVVVRALPDEGRPEGFSGAVGRFTVTAELAPRAVEVGKILEFVIRIEGDGNLGSFETPRLPDMPGFHVYGTIDDRMMPVRTITYEVAPTHAAVTEFPSLPFVFFDPAVPGTWRTAKTPSFPLEVTGGPEPIEQHEPAAGRTVPTELLAAIALLAALGIGLLLRKHRQKKNVVPPEPGPAEVFEVAIESLDADLAAAFTAYLSTRLDCPRAAVIGPDLAPRLVAAGVEEELAGAVAARVEDLVASRYGGEDATNALGQTRELVERLDRCFSGLCAEPRRR